MMLAALRCIPAALLAALSMAGPAEAHALLLASEPAAGAAVHNPSIDITLTFNSRVDPARSRLTLTKDGGAARHLALKRGNDPAILRSYVDGLNPGKFILHWQVLSVDGHISRGDLPFTVTAP